MDTLKKLNKTINNLFISQYKYIPNSLLIFQILIFLSLFQFNFCATFQFPTAITLTNENILIIHKNGIDVYDSSLSNLVKNVKEFTGDEILSETTLSEVAISNFDNDLIFAFIINKIYIMDSTGELLYEETKSSIISLFTGSFYDLILVKKSDYIYSYVIGFIPDNSLYIYFCEYNSNDKTNTCENSLTNIEISGYRLMNNILGCEIMSHEIKGDILLCFFHYDTSPHTFTFKYFDLSSYIEITELNSTKVSITDIKSMKTITSTDKKNCLICLSFSDATSECLTYSIESNSFSDETTYEINCKAKFYSTNLIYTKEKDEYIFSCVDDLGYIKAQIFDNNFVSVDNVITIVNGYVVYGSSVIYSKSVGNYLIISDIDSQNVKDKFISINGEHFENLTIITYMQEPTTVPTTIITSIPITTIMTSILTTIITTIPNPPTTMPETIPTKLTTIPEIIPYICNLEKCLSCNLESFYKKLCIQCNNNKNFYPISPLINMGNNIDSNGYIDCYNNSTKPSNFYFNKKTKYYEPCYKTCAACEYGGDGNQHNCTKCDIDHIFEPEKNGSTNCIAECTYYYYFSYGQYKCTTLPQCPDESNLLIRERRKCIDSCAKDPKYNYQYNGECIEKCPEDTYQDETNNLCKVINIDSCTQSSSTFDLYDFLKEGGVEKIAKNYATEFNYTNKHISLLKNEVYSIMLYKEKECISELGLPMPEIDFGDCYQKVQKAYDLQGKELIIAIIDKKNNKKSNPITSYAFYNPKNGDKLDSEEACKEEVIVVKENIKSLLNETSSDIDSILFLAGQNIDVFNKSSEFYTSICYHFDSPCDKDVALRDRLLIYYPNITLCDSGCTNKGVNLTSMMAICECKFKEITDDDTEEDDNLYKEVINQFNEILNQVNFAVMECYKDLFEYKFFISNTGGMIILAMIFVQIVALITFQFASLFNINKYIYNITENYLLYLNRSPMINNNIFNLPNKKDNNDNEQIDNENNKSDNNFPPKRQHSSKSDKTKNDLNKKYNVHRKNKRGETLRTVEGLKSNKVLISNNLKKSKQLIHKVKSYSNKNLERSDLSIKSNRSALINKSKNGYSFADYLSTDFDDMYFHDLALADKRLFFDYFCDKLKKKQLILQLFFSHSPLKPLTMKIIFLILDIEICFVVNAMFINENYVSKIFHSKTKEKIFTFVQRSINRCLYTISVSVVVSYFMGCLFVEESTIKGVLKRETHNINNLKYEINIVIKEIKIKYNIFIIITMVFSIFSWFYISCFNNIYPHMKLEWIKSSVLIIILIHILSIFIILIETLLRFISFEIKSERMYRASVWLG